MPIADVLGAGSCGGAKVENVRTVRLVSLCHTARGEGEERAGDKLERASTQVSKRRRAGDAHRATLAQRWHPGQTATTPRAVKEVLMAGFGASRMLDLQGPKMIARDFDSKVESRLHHKDIRIVLDLARTFGIQLPASAAAAKVLETLQQRGGARQDSAAIFSVLDTA